MVTTKRPDPKTTSKDERTRLAVVAFYKGEIEQRDIVKGVKKTLSFIMGRARTIVPKALTREVIM